VLPGLNLNPITSYLVKMWGPHMNFLTLMYKESGVKTVRSFAAIT